MSSAEFRVRAEGTVVRGTLRVDGEVFRTGPTRFPLLTGATLLDARTETGALPIVNREETHDAVLSGPAPFMALLEWGLTLEILPGQSSFVLPAAHAGSVSAIIDLPGELADVRVAPGFITRRQSASGRTILNVSLLSGQPSHVSWAVREGRSQTQPAEARMLADVKSLWRIGDADVQLVALVEITMIRGNARSFEFRLPPGFEVSSVNGSSLETSDSKGSTLTLTVRETPERRHQFLVSAERGHESGAFKLELYYRGSRSAGNRRNRRGGDRDSGRDGGRRRTRRMDVREFMRPAPARSGTVACCVQVRGDQVSCADVDVSAFRTLR
jgi:hypothetical protein